MKNTLVAAGLVILLFGTTHLALAIPDSNSIIVDEIEYYIQTDKSIYNLGEDVEMLYRVTNFGEEDVTFHFNDQIQYYFTVKQNLNLIWDVPKVGFPASSSFLLQPGEYKEYANVWNMLDNQDMIISTGIYEITGSLHPVLLSQEDKYRYVPVSVQVEIIPEPATLLLFGMGLVLARYRINTK